MRRFVTASLIIAPMLVMMLGLTAPAAHAQDEQCFDETGYCVSGRFLDYWQQNGGLAVFGYPITNAEPQENADGDTYLTQWFERNRFELHPENEPPYDVLLGLLGQDSLEQNGVDWQSFTKADPSAEHYFAETGHAIAPEFWDYWSSQGLEFDGAAGTSMQESLALFGYPISPATMEVNQDDGEMYLTQWFERTRFELHPENEPSSTVLLGLLGRELSEVAAETPEEPQEEQPGTPEEPQEQPQEQPLSVSERVSEECAATAPEVAEGAQVWLSDASPSPGDEVAICALLTVDGEPQADVLSALQIFYGPEHEPNFTQIPTDQNGFVTTRFTIDPSASPGDEIRVDASFANQAAIQEYYTLE